MRRQPWCSRCAARILREDGNHKTRKPPPAIDLVRGWSVCVSCRDEMEQQLPPPVAGAPANVSAVSDDWSIPPETRRSIALDERRVPHDVTSRLFRVVCDCGDQIGYAKTIEGRAVAVDLKPDPSGDALLFTRDVLAEMGFEIESGTQVIVREILTPEDLDGLVPDQPRFNLHRCKGTG